MNKHPPKRDRRPSQNRQLSSYWFCLVSFRVVPTPFAMLLRYAQFIYQLRRGDTRLKNNRRKKSKARANGGYRITTKKMPGKRNSAVSFTALRVRLCVSSEEKARHPYRY